MFVGVDTDNRDANRVDMTGTSVKQPGILPYVEV
jgi:hypothetical protein